MSKGAQSVIPHSLHLKRKPHVKAPIHSHSCWHIFVLTLELCLAQSQNGINGAFTRPHFGQTHPSFMLILTTCSKLFQTKIPAPMTFRPRLGTDILVPVLFTPMLGRTTLTDLDFCKSYYTRFSTKVNTSVEIFCSSLQVCISRTSKNTYHCE